MHPFIEPLSRRYQEAANPERAAAMKKYMKDHFEFYGIPTGERRSIMSGHIKQHGLPEWPEIDRICREFWSLDQRE